MNEISLRSKTGNIVQLARKWLGIILYVSVLCEIILFPTWANAAGCLMELIVWHIFKFFLKEKKILQHPFSFLAFLSLFLARYIPLPATLLEGKPITYGFEIPFQTFFWESILFLVAAIAFHWSSNSNSRKNNQLTITLHKLRFFETSKTSLWILGIIGLIVRIQQLAVSDDVEFGDVNNKFLVGLVYLQYAPILILFPSLSGIRNTNNSKKFVWIYIALIFIVSLATNSRQSMIYPIFTALLLFILSTVTQNISIFKLLSPTKIILIFLFAIFGLNLFSDISLAMLSTRSVRGKVNREELFSKTLETLQNEALMDRLRSTSAEDGQKLSSYSLGWDERYLNNFMLNRYGNLRVSDQTLYYANKAGYGNQKMVDNFATRIITILPLPVINFLGISINKADFLFSPGDMLVLTAGGPSSVLGGFRVTSLVADGLATFSYWCFPVICLSLFISFKLMDCFVYYRKGKITYSTLALITIFSFLGIFRNSIGCIVPVTYILRGFWQQCITFFLVILIVNTFALKKTKPTTKFVEV